MLTRGWKGAICALGLLAVASPAGAAPVARVLPAETETLTGDTLRFRIEVDMTGTAQRLGSYGAVLRWDPGQLRYASHAGGQPPFQTPVVNTLEVGSGILRFSDADPGGAAGRVTVIEVSFLVLVPPNPCAPAAVDLGFTSLFAAGTFDDLLPSLVVSGAVAYVSDFDYGLRAVDPAATILRWNPVPGAVDYDVIRGTVRSLRDDGAAIRLGAVRCLEDNSRDTTTAAGSEPASPDSSVPVAGDPFFYLVRFFDGGRNSTYGFVRRCTRERIPDSGDCP